MLGKLGWNILCSLLTTQRLNCKVENLFSTLICERAWDTNVSTLSPEIFAPIHKIFQLNFSADQCLAQLASDLATCLTRAGNKNIDVESFHR